MNLIQLIKTAPNYDFIINYKYQNNCSETTEILTYYRNFTVNSNIENDKELEQLDEIVYLYLINLDFMDYVNKELKKLESQMNISLYYYLNQFYNSFLKKLNTASARWL